MKNVNNVELNTKDELIICKYLYCDRNYQKKFDEDLNK